MTSPVKELTYCHVVRLVDMSPNVEISLNGTSPIVVTHRSCKLWRVAMVLNIHYVRNPNPCERLTSSRAFLNPRVCACAVVPVALSDKILLTFPVSLLGKTDNIKLTYIMQSTCHVTPRVWRNFLTAVHLCWSYVSPLEAYFLKKIL